MKCSDIRWQLSRFLNGETSPDTDELIRDHLDKCRACSMRLVSSNSMQSIKINEPVSFTDDVSKRVLDFFPESPSGMMMVRHLSWVFLISAAFAVGVFMVVKWLFTSSPTAQIDPSELVSGAKVTQLYTLLTANPMLGYVLLAIAATLLCVGLVVLVDSPKHAARNSR